MSSIIYSEAGDQSYAGKKAVGIVIANRVSSRSYPNTFKWCYLSAGTVYTGKKRFFKQIISII